MTAEQVNVLREQLERARNDYNASVAAVRATERKLDAEATPAAEKAVLQAEDAARLAKIRVESDQRKLAAAEAQLQSDTRDVNQVELRAKMEQLDQFSDGDLVQEQFTLIKRFIAAQSERQAIAVRKLGLMTQIRSLQMQIGHEPLVIDQYALAAVPSYQPIANALSELRPANSVEQLTWLAFVNLQIGSFQPKPRKDL